MCSESSTTAPAMAGTLPVRRGADEAPSTRPKALASSPPPTSGAVLEFCGMMPMWMQCHAACLVNDGGRMRLGEEREPKPPPLRKMRARLGREERKH
jgi:hypothetical protein